MMLRASGEYHGKNFDIDAVRDDAAAADSGVAHAEALLAFAEHAVGGDDDELARSRERLRTEMDDAALVDTAAIVGNFQRMTRIADATGIPLDPPVNALSADLQDRLGLTEFSAAENTVRPNRLVRGVVGALRPWLLKLAAGGLARARAKAARTDATSGDNATGC